MSEKKRLGVKINFGSPDFIKSSGHTPDGMVCYDSIEEETNQKLSHEEDVVVEEEVDEP